MTAPAIDHNGQLENMQAAYSRALDRKVRGIYVDVRIIEEAKSLIRQAIAQAFDEGHTCTHQVGSEACEWCRNPEATETVQPELLCDPHRAEHEAVTVDAMERRDRLQYQEARDWGELP